MPCSRVKEFAFKKDVRDGSILAQRNVIGSDQTLNLTTYFDESAQ